MKIRSGFVSNSSSASFIVAIPSTDREGILKTLYQQMEHIYFGKYYLRENIKERLQFAEEQLKNAKEKYSNLEAIPKEKRVTGRNNDYDPLDWARGDVTRWENDFTTRNEKLKALENIKENSEVELVEFGLDHYGIQFIPTYKTDKDIDESEIIGYQLVDWVTMFNEYGDLPKVLRNITGVLAFVYEDLKCWVDEDQD